VGGHAARARRGDASIRPASPIPIRDFLDDRVSSWQAVGLFAGGWIVWWRRYADPVSLFFG